MAQSRKSQRIVDKVKNRIEPADNRNPFVLLSSRISHARTIQAPKIAGAKESICIALVSLSSLAGDLEQRWSVDPKDLDAVDAEACLRQLVRYSPQATRKLFEWYRSSLVYALEVLEADIVCFNELAFPAFHQKPLKKALSLTRRLAHKHDAFIVAGSSHDRRTLYNTGHLFFPGCPEGGIPYHKQISAVSVHEIVSIPPVRKTLYTRIFGLHVAVLVCLDIADFASVAAVVKLADRVDVLLVPCFSDQTDTLENIAKATSQALSGIVILVNYHQRAAKPCIVTRFGETVAVESVDTPFAHGLIHKYCIDVNEFVEKKTQLQMDVNTDRMQWLFGPQNQTVRLR